jgi:D-alanyl-D-alanine carboxypeptidase/D-alanyl-D-alanine-endopeptidase (penicillin-binding protein 4)
MATADNHSDPTTRGVRATLVVVLAAGVMLVAACSTDNSDTARTTDGASAPVGSELPADAVAIMDTEPYLAARWPYLVIDPESGEVIYANLADQLMLLASQTKHFVVGSVYNDLGTDKTLNTPVYATAAPSGGTLDGDLVLVASGDLALGGRKCARRQVRFRNRWHRPRLRRCPSWCRPRTRRSPGRTR